MPRVTVCETQADLLQFSKLLLLSAGLLDETEGNYCEDLSQLADEEKLLADVDNEQFELQISEVLELAGAAWLEAASALTGDGSRGPYNQFPKSEDFFTTTLRNPDRQFRHQFRLGRDTFDKLISILAPNPIFRSKGKKPQRHVKYQLGCFLMRYGSHGSDVLGTAMKMSVGYGTVVIYCRRVTRALRQLRERFVGWQTGERKQDTMERIEAKSGFPKCVGSGDGSLFRLEERPMEDGEAFQGRKKFNGTNVQATVDDRTMFTSFEIGWPAAVPDVKVFKQSYLWQHRNQYLPNGEYLLMDKGYPSSPYVMRPFSEPEIKKASPSRQERMRKFNQRLSSVRISVEHAFGILKGRFLSLRVMGAHDDMQEIYRVMEALIVLHNICIELEDRPEDIIDFVLQLDSEEYPPEDFDADEDIHVDDIEDITGQPQIPGHETDSWLKKQGYRKRLALLEELIPP